MILLIHDLKNWTHQRLYRDGKVPDIPTQGRLYPCTDGNANSLRTMLEIYNSYTYIWIM